MEDECCGLDGASQRRAHDEHRPLAPLAQFGALGHGLRHAVGRQRRIRECPVLLVLDLQSILAVATLFIKLARAGIFDIRSALAVSNKP